MQEQRRGLPGWHMAAGGEGPKRGELRAQGHQQQHAEVYKRTGPQMETEAHKGEAPRTGKRRQQQASQGQQKRGLGKHTEARAAGPRRSEPRGQTHPQKQAKVHTGEAHKTRVSARNQRGPRKGKRRHP